MVIIILIIFDHLLNLLFFLLSQFCNLSPEKCFWEHNDEEITMEIASTWIETNNNMQNDMHNSSTFEPNGKQNEKCEKKTSSVHCLVAVLSSTIQSRQHFGRMFVHCCYLAWNLIFVCPFDGNRCLLLFVFVFSVFLIITFQVQHSFICVLFAFV